MLERWQEAVEAMTEDERAKLYWDALIYGTCMVSVPAEGPLGDDIVRRVDPTRIILKGDGAWEGVAPLNAARLPPVDTSGWEVATDDRGTTVVQNSTTYAGNINPAGLGLSGAGWAMGGAAPDRGPMGGGLPGSDVEALDADDARWIQEEHEVQARLSTEDKP